MKFSKYHALGNDYLVLDPSDSGEPPSSDEIKLLCHRNFGIGSDGILFGPEDSLKADFGLRIFNPDGSEAEKSGNGLRIFSRYLRDSGRVSDKPFTILTKGGIVRSEITPDGSLIKVEMGKVSFHSEDIPVRGSPREVLDESITLEGKAYRFYAATIGNPHCVLPMEEISAALARKLGPILEKHPLFPNRTNVQFLKVLDRRKIQIEIWERGAGYTLASGSSSSAAAAVAFKMGIADPDLTVIMPGGAIGIRLQDDFSVIMTGPATRIGSIEFDKEAFSQRIPDR